MKISTDSMTIYESLKNIENSKWVMPAFQRQYVWSMYQIEKLWDSILLGYPIASFLFWFIDKENVTNETYFCNFLKTARFDSRKSSDLLNFDVVNIDPNKTKIAILDGQQRLTSLYISLIGDVTIRPKNARKGNGWVYLPLLLIELDKNKIDTDEDELNSKVYDIKFTEKVGQLSPTQFKIKEIMNPKYYHKNDDGTVCIDEIELEAAIKSVPPNSKDYAKECLTKLFSKIFVDPVVQFTQMYNMSQDDALEMFVRFNSGGKVLRKSDITMSILEAGWPRAKERFGSILSNGYDGFGSDFIIRTALMIYGDVSKSTIDKKVVNYLMNNWESFKNAFINLKQLIQSFNIDFDRFKSSWNVLIPIIYCIYYNPNYLEDKMAIKAYIARAILFNLFQSGTTQRLASMQSSMNSFEQRITLEMLDQMSELRITPARIEELLDKEKGSRTATEMLYYLSLDWHDKRVRYEVDHLHPEDKFSRSNPPRITLEHWRKLSLLRNKIPNLHLLEGRQNASKNNMDLVDYYNDMTVEQKKIFIRNAMIPSESLLSIDDFEEFYEKRRKLISEKITKLLQNGYIENENEGEVDSSEDLKNTPIHKFIEDDEVLNNFKSYLDNKYSNNTSNTYFYWFNRVKNKEGYENSRMISEIEWLIKKYGPSGLEDDFGQQGNGSCINALRAFSRYLNSEFFIIETY